jgi:gliding motility-associated lipoprotein GldD
MYFVRISKIFIILCCSLVLFSCSNTDMPLPYGYFRVDLPAHNYKALDADGTYKFDYSTSAEVQQHLEKGHEKWVDIKYPYLNASIYCSYLPVNGNLEQLLEDGRKFVYKHSVKADGIAEKVYLHPEKRMYGILYDLKGNTASSVQFILTDSSKHFFRGSLYFDNVPNKDSIAPMVKYIREDVIRIMESFEWKK